MTLFSLYQTEIWKSKTSRIYFGVFDSREKAKDCAKYYGLYAKNAKVIIEEVALNQFQEC